MPCEFRLVYVSDAPHDALRMAELACDYSVYDLAGDENLVIIDTRTLNDTLIVDVKEQLKETILRE